MNQTHPMPRRARRVLKALAALVVAFAIVAGLLYAAIGNPLDPFDDRRFSGSRWSAAGHQMDFNKRAGMAGDLVRRHLRVGMTEDDVRALLGPEEGSLSGEDVGGNRLPGVHAFSYNLGNWSTYGFDDAFLYVCFDAAGRFVSSEINGY